MSDTRQTFSSMRNLSIGSSGKDVSDLQQSLNKRPPSGLSELVPDGVFGKKTNARVIEFQKNKGLVPDGVVGPKTRAALAGSEPGTADRGCNCSNTENFSLGQPREFADFFRNNRIKSGNKLGFAVSSSSSSSGASTASGSGPLRMLDTAQKALAIRFFGSSLDFSTIFISNKTGIGGRPFTIAFKDSNQIVQIMNCGSFTPVWSTLIHELGHVWQSQHHSNKFRFMVNAVDSQAGAIVASTAAVIDDPIVALNTNFPTFYPFDAYAYNPGLPFANMAAEQMAKVIENAEGAVLAHVRSVTMNMVDSACVSALSRPGFADRRMPGVK